MSNSLQKFDVLSNLAAEVGSDEEEFGVVDGCRWWVDEDEDDDKIDDNAQYQGVTKASTDKPDWEL